MSATNLHRVQEDLATIRRAVGLELPFGRADVLIAFCLGPAGLFALVWTLIPHGLKPHWGLLPMVAVVIAYTIAARVRFRRGSGLSPSRRREYTFALILMVVVGGLSLVYRIWAGPLGLTFVTRAAIAIFFAGMLSATLALSHPGRIAGLGLAIPLLVAGVLMPYVAIPPAGVFGAAMAVGGPVAGIIQWRQLRRLSVPHAAD